MRERRKLDGFKLPVIILKRVLRNQIENIMSLLRKIFGLKPKADYAGMMDRGAIIVDVRTFSEYRNGHIKGSLNIPLESLGNNLSKLKKDKCIICCCASGMRSSSAKRLLKSKGFIEVYNGGSWMGLQNKIS